MTMIDVKSVNSAPGEAELLAHAADYMAARLFTVRQRKGLTVVVNLTRDARRVPVTRRMLGPQKAGLGSKAPTLFEMTVSTAHGIRDAAETIAHELLHISQAVNGRLVVTSKKKRIDGRKAMVDMARWMGGKPLVIDNLAWHLRPWEIEACHWQACLVDEFLGMSTGQVTDQPVQSPKRRQLALYPVRLAVVPTQAEPAFDGIPTSDTGVNPAGPDPLLPAVGSVASNSDSIDRLFTGAMGGELAPDRMVTAATDQTVDTRDPADPIEVAPTHSEPAPTPQPRQADGDVAGDQPAVQNTAETPDLPPSETRAPLAAMPDRPVYPRPVIEVSVPGLDAPRALERESMMKKLSELQERGLAATEETS